MRIYVTRQGRKTSISVDDKLIAYLQRRLKGKSHSNPRLWIQHMIDAAADQLPDTHLSQWMQERIIDVIADPQLKDEQQKAEDAKWETLYYALRDERRQQWGKEDSVRQLMVDAQERHLQALKALKAKTPKHKHPPKIPVL